MASEEHSKPFLSRWSRRKLAVEEAAEIEKKTAAEITPESTSTVEVTEAPDTAQTQSVEDKPLWQRDDIDPREKQQAMRDLFRKPKFNQVDGLDEYDNDYNYHNFAKLGDVITHEMRSRLAAQAESIAASAQSTEHTETQAEASETSVQSSDNKEEKPLA